MNLIKGQICELLNQEDIVIVKILSKEVIFSVLMLELKSLENLKIGVSV
ncbi:molybdenum-pterin-binding protein, partial [Campylobacter jejuni]|nr:molybdenum-pterin-binding protein [Campylobacter jejuni]HEG6236980.1 molybdenum-pterin-binding protein [Campylobacter jejuni]